MGARRRADGVVRVGITAYAQDALGDVVYVTLPEVGATVSAGDACGEVESTKSVSDLYAPVSGDGHRRNDELDATPELVNTDPYGEGWLFELRARRRGRRGGRRTRRGRPIGEAQPDLTSRLLRHGHAVAGYRATSSTVSRADRCPDPDGRTSPQARPADDDEPVAAPVEPRRRTTTAADTGRVSATLAPEPASRG